MTDVNFYNIIAINETEFYNDAAIKKTGDIYCLYIYIEDNDEHIEHYYLYPLYNVFENFTMFEPHFKFFENLIDSPQDRIRKDSLFNDERLIHLVRKPYRIPIEQIIENIKMDKLDITYKDLIILKDKGISNVNKTGF